MGACLNAINAQSELPQSKVITGRVARNHYGIATKVPFTDGDDDKYRFYDDITGQFMCEKISWVLSRVSSNPTDLNI